MAIESDKDIQFNFENIYQKINNQTLIATNSGQELSYNLFEDKQALSEVFTEVSTKGFLTFDY